VEPVALTSSQSLLVGCRAMDVACGPHKAGCVMRMGVACGPHTANGVLMWVAETALCRLSLGVGLCVVLSC
jgi:hypothetical protein